MTKDKILVALILLGFGTASALLATDHYGLAIKFVNYFYWIVLAVVLWKTFLYEDKI